MAPEDTFKTEFKILNMMFIFKKIPFGLTNAPATFQNAMNNMFKNTSNVLIYLDDVLLFSQSFEEHYTLISDTFSILHQNNVSINFEKSEFFKEKINYLGHEISSEGIRPNVSKLENFTYKQPKTRTA
ncbi:Retrovirus-related Pol polyprotein from transposon 17.6 [Dictyocoela muelleri]|nr:Retrovirus-related Pol polyprotein from transposon 17.6 [Dictyocoela muelleri]